MKTRHSTFAPSRSRQPRQAVALVITLILLSLITFLAVTFLMVARRGSAQAGQTANLTDAEIAAMTGRDRALASIIARMAHDRDLLSMDVQVSANRDTLNSTLPVNRFLTNITALLVDPVVPVFVKTNLRANLNLPLDFRYYLDLNRNARYETNTYDVVTNFDGTNVVIFTNAFIPGDPAWIGMLRDPFVWHGGTNPFIYRYAYLALPEGNMLDINANHNQSKQYVLKNGTALEGFLRNQGYGSWEINLASFLADLNPSVWNNLLAPAGHAARYDYITNLATQSKGYAFADSFSFVTNRYGQNFNTGLYAANRKNILGTSATARFGSDGIDSYGNGPLWMGVHLTNMDSTLVVGEKDVPANNPWPGWPGAPSTNEYFTISDFLNPSKTSTNFAQRLLTNGFYGTKAAAVRDFDSHTFYRLISQLGMNTAPLPVTNLGSPKSGLINLNYDNWTVSSLLMQDWSTNTFFSNVVVRLSNLRPGLFPFTRNGIQIPIFNGTNDLRTNYTHELHQLMQIAANIWDANHPDKDPGDKTDQTAPGYYHYPSCFRPRFAVNPAKSDEIDIVDYYEDHSTNVLGATNLDLGLLESSATNNALVQGVLNEVKKNNNHANAMVWGIPTVIGARKGYPNFNEYYLQTDISWNRRVFLSRTSTTSLPNRTNILWIMSITNTSGVEAWNSYLKAYPRSLRVVANNLIRLSLYTNVVDYKNRVNAVLATTNSTSSLNNYAANGWPGWNLTNDYKGTQKPDPSFQVPLLTNVPALLPSAYYRVKPSTPPGPPGLPTLPFGQTVPGFVTILHSNPQNPSRSNEVFYGFPNDPNPQDPEFWIRLENKVMYALLDTSVAASPRVVDYVLMDGLTLETNMSLSVLFQKALQSLGKTDLAGQVDPIMGRFNQIQASLGQSAIYTDKGVWESYNGGGNTIAEKERSVDAFRVFVGLSPLKYPKDQVTVTNLFMQAPFTPWVRVKFGVPDKAGVPGIWEVNDPLVHYLAEDLIDLANPPENAYKAIIPPTTPQPSGWSNHLGKLNFRYRPWNGNPARDPNADPLAWDLRVKDALVRYSDDWEFPTNRFANIGLLSLVHRGTPWQTIYFKAFNKKADDQGDQQWAGWANDRHLRMHPTNDWRLADVFTIAPHPHATRGLLPINQPGLAAWSAVLGGLVGLKPVGTMPDGGPNHMPNSAVSLETIYQPEVLTPGSGALTNIYNAIIRHRNSFPHHRFNHISDLLTIPELTINSPLVAGADPKAGISDSGYKRIPQLLLSLLREEEPRYVIYSWGQALKPAPGSINFQVPANVSARAFKVCTNYQVVAEAATRTVVRFEDVSTPLPAGSTNFPSVVAKPIIEQFNFLPPE